MKKLLAAALLPALLLGGAAAAQSEAPKPKQASIPFVDHDGVRNFESDKHGEGVWLQDRHRNWYYARFFSRCQEMPFAVAIGFRTWGGGGSLSRGDTILVGRERCRIADLVRSGPPPKKAKKARAKGA